VTSVIKEEETQLSMTNRATHLEVSQGHQTWPNMVLFHMLGMVSY